MRDLLKAFQEQVGSLTKLRDEVFAAEDNGLTDQQRHELLNQLDDTIEDCEQQILNLELRAFDNDIGRRAKRLRKLRADLLELDPKYVDEKAKQKLLSRLNEMLAKCGEEELDFEIRHQEAFPEADNVLAQFRATKPH